MSTDYHAVMHTPIGCLGLRLSGAILALIDFLPKDTPEHCASPAAAPMCAALGDYFARAHPLLMIPYRVDGTPFQQRVWAALCEIPLGKTRTYGTLARQLKTSARAVGGACARNPLPIVIPCHRVVGGQNLGGYTGATSGDPLEIKRFLLWHETHVCASALVDNR